jgi:hypothetical protein
VPSLNDKVAQRPKELGASAGRQDPSEEWLLFA